jgi:hypothetical protein
MRIEKPKDGDYRYVTKFLWMPKRFDGIWVWLETVTIRQCYFYNRVLIRGWANVCLSNPLTGLPASFKDIGISDKLLAMPMNKNGKYYVKS